MAILYILISTAMFFLYQGGIFIGGFGVMYYYMLGIGLVAIAFMAFLVKPNVERAVRLGKESGMLALSSVIPLLISAFIWAFTFARTNAITRGFFCVIYQLISLMFAYSSVYLFGKKSIRYCLISMLLANGLVLLSKIVEFGAGPFFREFLDLVLSFGMNTGDIVRSLEIHDLTFALGLFFLYGLIADKESRLHPLLMIATLFFLLVGLKRIGLVAIVLVVLIIWLLKRFREKTAKSLTLVVCGGVIVVCYVYLFAVKNGLFEYLETVWDIDTKGRMALTKVVNTLYELDPSFMGKGLGFNSVSWSELGIDSMGVTQNAFHNDFLRMYVEIGFIGFLIWMVLLLPCRVNYFWKKKGMNAGLITLAMVLYCCVTYATDNTLYYYYTNTALYLLILGHSVELPEGETAA